MNQLAKEELKGTLEIIGKVVSMEFKDPKNENEEINLQVKLSYKNTSIYVYVKSEQRANEFINYKVNDVIRVKGNFLANWYPSIRNILPIIDEVYEVEKLGILK